MTTMAPERGCGSTDERLLIALREMGPQTVEELTTLPGLSWSQVFFAIDRLSRRGTVSVRRTQLCGYQVRIHGTAV